MLFIINNIIIIMKLLLLLYYFVVNIIYYYEIIGINNCFMSVANMQIVENYLSAKWGI
jgi:hypothetical protein